MNVLKSLVNLYAGLGVAAAVTAVGVATENPYLTTTGIFSGGGLTVVKHKTKNKQPEDLLSTEIRTLTNKIKSVENKVQQQFTQSQQNLEKLASQ